MHKQLVFKYYITQAQPTIMHLVILGVWLSVSLVCLFSSICCPQIASKLVYSIKVGMAEIFHLFFSLHKSVSLRKLFRSSLAVFSW